MIRQLGGILVPKISPEIIKIKYFDEISREKISIKIFKSVS